MLTKCFVPLQNVGVMLAPLVLCCLFLVSEFHPYHIIFSLVGLLSGHLLEQSCSLGLPYVLFVFYYL